MRMLAAGSLVVLGAVLGCAGCESDELEYAKLVAPSFGEPCRYTDCSGHGACDEAEDGGPICLCDVGYLGERCQGCEAGFHLDAMGRCVSDRACAEQETNPCGAHGSCDDAEGVIACRCDMGYEGPRCTLCQTGWGRDGFGNCLILVLGGDASGLLPSDAGAGAGMGAPGPTTPPLQIPPNPCIADSCSGHGLCNGTTGQVVCTCGTGYAGATCGTCAEGYVRDLSAQCVPREICAADGCGAHGTCDDSTGVIACTCELGFGGARCDTCAPGFHGEGGGCAADVQCLSTTCAGHGTCTASAGTTSCSCDARYTGTNCQSCATGHHRDPAGACVIDQVCQAADCHGHGTCNDSTGVVICACAPGYTGPRCSSCSAGFHDPGNGTCVLDQQCQPGSCPVHSTCGDSTGAIECLCDLGYEGSSCDTCAPGYYRNDAVNTCIPIACGGNPIEAAGLATFEDVAGFPTFDNNCRGDLPLDFGDLVLSSFGGEGSVWACDTSTFYGLSTKHVFLEAGTLGAATLGFAGPIATLVFDYGARSALALEVIADGVVVGNLTANKNASGRLTYTFATPTTLVELRSVNTTTSQIGLDNISYVPPACN